MQSCYDKNKARRLCANRNKARLRAKLLRQEQSPPQCKVATTRTKPAGSVQIGTKPASVQSCHEKNKARRLCAYRNKACLSAKLLRQEPAKLSYALATPRTCTLVQSCPDKTTTAITNLVQSIYFYFYIRLSSLLASWACRQTRATHFSLGLRV